MILLPEEEKNGKRGKREVPGFEGKNGGDTGSFLLKAFEISDFHLVNIQKIPGVGSKGGKGSKGGYGGDRGRNGRDGKNLCDRRLSRPKKGDEGRRGRSGRDGRDGKEGTVCLEKLIPKETAEIKINSENQEVKIVCEEKGAGQSCREVLVEKKESVICY